ncbi:hypothetical protein V6N13_025412 [Hibiscus sabdariffa]
MVKSSYDMGVRGAIGAYQTTIADIVTESKRAPIRGESIDQLGWMLNTDRRFMVKSSYDMGVRGMEADVDPDVDHLLRSCAMSIAVWSSVVKPSRLQEFITMDLHAWVNMYLRNSGSFVSSCEDWNMFSRAIVWNIWLNCNSIAFGMQSDDCRPVLECSMSLFWSTQVGDW